jgi:hypothetical protein
MIRSIVFEHTEIPSLLNHVVNLPFAIAVPDGASSIEWLLGGEIRVGFNRQIEVEAILRDK